MKRFASILIMLTIASVLGGCIISKTPDSDTVYMEIGEQVAFSIYVIPNDQSYIWTLDGTVVQDSWKAYYYYTATGGEHTLTVEAKHVFGTDKQTWTIISSRPPTAEAGPDQTVIPGAEVILDGSGSSDPDGEIVLYAWQQTGGPTVVLSNAGSEQASFTAPDAGPLGATLTFQLTVTDNEGLTASDTCLVFVQGDTKKLTENALYAAYAGIGYMRADNIYDDEPLYDIMLDDLNTMAGDFVLDTIFNDPQVLIKLINVALGITTTFTYTNASGVVSRLTIDPGGLVSGYRSFVADLSINFNPTGYVRGDITYYGNTGVNDLTANVTGYFKATTTSLDELFLSNVTIEAKNTLRAVYPAPLGEVVYNLWKISYNAYYGEVDPTYTPGMSTYPVNMEIVPTIISEPLTAEDFRDYTLSGGLNLNGDAYLFPVNGIRYRQWQYDGRTLIALNGGLVPPGLTSTITVSSPDDTVNPLASGTIVRSLAGIWTSGIMYISGISSASQVVFNSNGSCLFSGGDQGDWTVLSWQNNLEP